MRFLGYLEHSCIRMAGRVFGIGIVVRYLRNPNPRISVKLLRAFGATIGAGATIKGSIFVDNVQGDRNSSGDFSHLTIGRNCYVGDAVFFDLANNVVIEDNAVIAGRVSILTHAECGRSPVLNRVYPRTCEPVVIGSGAWVGFGATILSGVTVGTNATIGASSLVLGDVQPETVCAGMPARKLKKHEFCI